MVSPALAVAPVTPLTSAVLVREMFGQLTVMSVGPALESPEPSLEVAKWARLDTAAAQVAVVVGLVMRTVKLAPAPRSGVGPPQVSTPVAIAQTGVVGVWEATVQVVPALVGTVSVMVKPWATPVPLLVATMV